MNQIQEKALLISDETFSYVEHRLILEQRLSHIKKDYGLFFTPEWVVKFMVNLIDFKLLEDRSKTGEDIRILEPACGLGQFLNAIKDSYRLIAQKARFIGVEINQDVLDYLKTFSIGVGIELINCDYLLWETKEKFDLIIGNPPYGIPSPSDHYSIKVNTATRRKYRSLFETWYGKYNVYGAFIEKSIKLLKPGGQLIFIVPSTFMILDEFKKLRKFIAKNGGLAIVYLGSDVFKPEADVSVSVINFIKSDKFIGRVELLDLTPDDIKTVKVISSWNGEVITFETELTQKLKKLCSYKLGDIYEVKISPRTPEIKNNPYIATHPKDRQFYLPVLNGKNLKCGEIIYENLTGYWIKTSELEKFPRYFAEPHVVVGLGFRENGNVAAAYDSKCYPWMGDVYHLLRKNETLFQNFDMSDGELVDYLNSDYVKHYIKDTYRDITYHLNITMLKNLPVPNRKEWAKIRKEIAL
ncbi:MAG: N-6 DNA methylase [Candidatus Kryptonium sp.]|nr:N-6 DNA methylase [Candidatus Kryptonium sp.]